MDEVSSIKFGSECRGELSAHAREAFPNECCGILVGRRDGTLISVYRVIRARNIAAGDRRTRYQVDWETLVETRRALHSMGTGSSPREIVGFYHSHPDGTSKPSRADVSQVWAGHVYVIIPVTAYEAGLAIGWYARGGDIGFERCRADNVHRCDTEEASLVIR